ncbi:hypothetical protein PRZ48_010871 [Zasmidium cellare]|uniref:Uncharacterized protein n=1 Tax=Zasmidium cellare TaxID=395010 RepID=A0ABR0E9W2_ZASCE|nr:hypothetical protein PRZ48_010871 [Zasmidium cellare]
MAGTTVKTGSDFVPFQWRVHCAHAALALSVITLVPEIIPVIPCVDERRICTANSWAKSSLWIMSAAKMTSLVAKSGQEQRSIAIELDLESRNPGSRPRDLQPWFPEALDYMGHFMRRGWSALRATPAEQDEAMLWVRRLTMKEPTYFLMNMLSLMGDLVSRGQKDPRLLVWLTSQCVGAINEALSDPAKSLAVGTMLTVGRLALREIVIGDMTSGITYHRPAFARMIVMAGGIDALKLPPLVRSHLAWGDRMMSRKTGISISQIEPMLASEPTFSGGGLDENARGDVQVLDSYLPYRTRKPGSPTAEAMREETSTSSKR